METSLDWSVWLPAWIVVIIVYAGIQIATSGGVVLTDVAGVAAGFGLGLLAIEVYRRVNGTDPGEEADG